jgi:hypothetical protein
MRALAGLFLQTFHLSSFIFCVCSVFLLASKNLPKILYEVMHFF